MVRNKILLIFLTLVLVIAFLFTACAKPAPAPAPPPAPKVIEWNLSMWGGAGARIWPIHTWWVEEIEKRTGGRLKVTTHLGAALAPSKEQLDGLKAGLYDMCHFATAYHPGKNPLGSFFDLPGLTPADLKEMAQLELAFMEHPAAKKEMAERWNAVYIGLSHTRPHYTFLGTKPIRTLEDFEGQRVRVGGEAAKLVEKLGGVGLMIPAPEVYEAISKGTLDHSYFAPASHQGYKIHEVSKYFIYNIGLGSGMGWFGVANKDSWDALPADIKEIHRELAQELMLERLPAEMNKKCDEIFADWKARGIEFMEFPAEGRAMIEAEGKAVQEAYAEKLEAEGLPGREVLAYLLAKRMEISGY